MKHMTQRWSPQVVQPLKILFRGLALVLSHPRLKESLSFNHLILPDLPGRSGRLLQGPLRLPI